LAVEPELVDVLHHRHDSIDRAAPRRKRATIAALRASLLR